MMRTWYAADVLKKDGKIYFSRSQKEIKKGSNGFYIKVTDKNGCSFDGKKISVWYGKSWDPRSYYHHIVALGHNWITPDKLVDFITKGVAEKILSGDITNPKDLLKQYLKNSRIKASPTLLYKYILSGGTKMLFLSHISVVRNVDNYLRLSLSNNLKQYHMINDIVQQAKILNEKIDFGWSKKRLKDEHNKMTNLLMLEELKYIKNHRVVYNNKVMEFIDDLPKDNFRLLETERDLFIEGSTMKHCVYTNYKDSVLVSKYVVFHVTYCGDELTLGCKIDNDNKIIFSQLYGIGNKQPNKESVVFVERFFKIKEEICVPFDGDEVDLEWANGNLIDIF